jgi:anaerobic selenocysteine-containing dehydrogenase
MTRKSFLGLAAIVGTSVGLSSALSTNQLREVSSAYAAEPEVDIKRVRSCCRGCGKMECGVWVTVQNGRAIKVEGDESAFQSRGNCCTKSQSSVQAAYHPDRMYYPMKRTNPKGTDDPGWVRITWDEACKISYDKFEEIKEKYGGEALFSMSGTSRIWSMQAYGAWKFFFGSPNNVIPYQVCKGPRHFATCMVSQCAYSWMATVDRPRVFIQWAGCSELSNYDDSCRTTVEVAKEADYHIIVDPRQTNLGKEADLWLPLRSGTDAVIAMSMTHVIIENKLYDDLYVKRWMNAPFLVCKDIELSGFSMANGVWELKTRLLKESDIKEGGNPHRFMVWDQLAGIDEAHPLHGNDPTGHLTYYDCSEGVTCWEGEEWKPQTEGREARQKNLVSGVLQGWVADPSPFNPEIDPALFGEFEIELKDGRKVLIRPVFDLYAEACAQYAPEKAEAITEVPAADIEQAALLYATRLDPDSGYANGGIQYMLGVEHATNAIQNIRAIDSLIGIVGGMDIPGGNRGMTKAPMGQSGGILEAFTTRLTLDQRKKILGREKFPLLYWALAGTSFSAWADAASVWDAVATGDPYPVKGVVCQSGDFMSMSNSLHAWEQINKLDFYLHIDLWRTPGAGAADVLMPCTHWIEVNCGRISQGSSGAYGATCRAVDPPAECKWDPTIFSLICKAGGEANCLDPDNPNPEDEYILDNDTKRSIGMTWQEYSDAFQEHGWWDAKAVEGGLWGIYRRYEVGQLSLGLSMGGTKKAPGKEVPGYSTPTQKQELWSTVMESFHPDQGWELPTFTEPVYSPVSAPELFAEYPFNCITGRRQPTFFHSEHRQLPWCRELWPVPRVEINPADAEKLDIRQGDWVWIESPEGKIREVADLYYGIRPGQVNLEHQWWYPELEQADKGFSLSGANCLIDRHAQDPHAGISNLRSYAVKIYKATPENSPFGNPVPCDNQGKPIIHTVDDPRLKEWAIPLLEGRV